RPVAGMTISARSSPGWAGAIDACLKVSVAMIVLQIDVYCVVAFPGKCEPPVARYPKGKPACLIAGQQMETEARRIQFCRLPRYIQPRQNEADFSSPIGSDPAVVAFGPITLERL